MSSRRAEVIRELIAFHEIKVVHSRGEWADRLVIATGLARGSAGSGAPIRAAHLAATSEPRPSGAGRISTRRRAAPGFKARRATPRTIGRCRLIEHPESLFPLRRVGATHRMLGPDIGGLHPPYESGHQPSPAGITGDYHRTITGPSDEARLLAAVPWFLGWSREPRHLLRCLKSEAERFAELPDPPTFSLIATLGETPPLLLNELILSVRLQSWSRWELILADDGGESTDHLPLARDWTRRDRRIRLLESRDLRGPSEAKNRALETACGEFLCVVESTSLLHPCALGILARHLIADRDLNLIFSLEARVNAAADRIEGFLYKPPFDLFMLLRTNYVGHLTAIERGLLQSAARGGPVFRREFDGLDDHDLMIRIALSGQAKARSVPFFLYYQRDVHRPSPSDATYRAMIEDSLPRAYPGCRWKLLPPSPVTGNIFHGIHLHAVAGRPEPSLLAIVPFKDRADLTVKCLDSIERQQHDPATWRSSSSTTDRSTPGRPAPCDPGWPCLAGTPTPSRRTTAHSTSAGFTTL